MGQGWRLKSNSAAQLVGERVEEEDGALREDQQPRDKLALHRAASGVRVRERYARKTARASSRGDNVGDAGQATGLLGACQGETSGRRRTERTSLRACSEKRTVESPYLASRVATASEPRTLAWSPMTSLPSLRERGRLHLSAHRPLILVR